ncbi:MAG: helix-turn-helix domain-containing protein [Terracoccus sp.]
MAMADFEPAELGDGQASRGRMVTTATVALEGRLLTSAEVAQLIRVPPATLRYWRHIGIGPRSFKMGPRRVLYRAEDVAAWVATQYAHER